MNIRNVRRARPAAGPVLLLMLGAVFCAYDADGAERTVLGELFSSDG